MKPERLEQIDQIFQSALDLAPERRADFLDVRCGGDVELRAEVESLLEAHHNAGDFIEDSASDVATALLEMQPVPRQVGQYKIEKLLGAGGMGEVYLAVDTRLDRRVAIKFLPAEFSTDGERVLRFQHEARTTSLLNHPNIITIYEIGDTGGRQFIVSEYIDGKTLRQYTEGAAGKRIKLTETLSVAIQVAHALDAAHQAGVVHRDIKPENIIIRKDGLVKVLDFGIAKLARDSKPSTDRLSTRTGVVMGTASYMSPEQARGQKVDHRTDIFSLGVVLYEMLSGQKPFIGDTATDVMAGVLTNEPAPLIEIAPEISTALSRIVHRCLEKEREKRFQSAGDLAFALEEATSLSGSKAVPSAWSSAVTSSMWSRVTQRRLGWIVAALLALTTLVLLATFVFRDRTSTDAVRFFVAPPETTTFSLPDSFAISPDGRKLALAPHDASGKVQIWVRPLNSLTAQPLPGTEGARAPFWSPDSNSIAFFANGKLMTVPANGGPVTSVCDASGFFTNGTWSRDGVILFEERYELYRVSASGGEAARLMPMDQANGELANRQPRFLPDGRHFLYAVASRQLEKTGIYVGSLEQPRGKMLVRAEANAGYSAGYLLFLRQSTLAAQAFDVDRLQLTGDPFTISQRMEWPIENPSAVSGSQNGTLVYLESPSVSNLTWFDRSGKRLGVVGSPALYSNPALSPDERLLAVDVRDPQINTRDIWLFDLPRGTSSRFTFDPADDLGAVWSPDGSHIAFTSDRRGHRDFYQKMSTGAGEDELLFESPESKNIEDWSPDGQMLIYNIRDLTDLEDLWLLPLVGERKPSSFLKTHFIEDQSQFSPDGHWIAYTSNETGRDEVYVREFPKGGRWQISTDSGEQPKWRKDGKELFYIAGRRRFMAVDVNTASNSFVSGAPHFLFETNMFGVGRNWYVVTGDGQRFLVRSLAEEGAPSALTVVLNWTAGVRR